MDMNTPRKSFRNWIIHLRIPFSVYLLPVFGFATATLPSPDPLPLLLLFVLLHLVVYPSSNAYNSIMDRDTGSIGGIKSPPPMPHGMRLLCAILDLLAVLCALLFFNSHWIAVGIGLYIMASRAYSNRRIRIKKYPVLSYLHVVFFQGWLIFSLVHLLSNSGAPFWANLPQSPILWALSALLVGAAYPLTQVYQHESDRQDRVQTLSMLLGIRGTFLFSGVLLSVMALLFILFLYSLSAPVYLFGLMLLCFAPVLVYFSGWTLKVFQDASFADYNHTMRMNNIGSLGVNSFLIIFNIHQHFL